MKRIYMIIIGLLVYMTSACQTVVLNTVASADGPRDKSTPRYAFSGYTKDSTTVYINLKDSTVSFGEHKFMLLSNPCKWNIQPNYKYCTFWGCDSNYRKVFVKLFRYDSSSRSKICVFSEDKAWRFIGNE